MGNHVEDLNKYAVRIKEGQRVLGSGVLWKPKSCEQNHIYVFTAAHVIKNHENVEVEFWHHENVVKLSVEKNMIAISKTYHQEGDFGDGVLVVLFHRKMLHPPKKVSAPYRVETFLKFK